MSPQDRNKPLVVIRQSTKQWQFHMVTVELRNKMRSEIQHTTYQSNLRVSLYKPDGWVVHFAGETYQRHIRETGVTVTSPSATVGS